MTKLVIPFFSCSTGKQFSLPLASVGKLLKSTRFRSEKDVTVLGSKIPRQGPTSFKGLLISMVCLAPRDD